jgi:hypothetical protein
MSRPGNLSIKSGDGLYQAQKQKNPLALPKRVERFS